jgi:hypothetical protein
LIAIFAMLSALCASCAPIPQVGPIDSRAYLESAAPRPEDRLDALSIQPVGLRKGQGRTLILDVVLEGPPAVTDKAALFVRSGIYFDPARWLEVVNPEGRRLTLVPVQGATSPSGNGMELAPEYRLQRDVTSVRLLLACRFATRTPLRGGRYGVRLERDAVVEELRSMVRGPFLIAEGWYRFGLVRGSLRDEGVEGGWEGSGSGGEREGVVKEEGEKEPGGGEKRIEE